MKYLSFFPICLITALGYTVNSPNENDFTYTLEETRHFDDAFRTLFDQPDSIKEVNLQKGSPLLFSLEPEPDSLQILPLQDEALNNAPFEKTQNLPITPQQQPVPSIQPVQAPTTGTVQPSATGAIVVENESPQEPASNKILINFNNVSIIEYIRFISRISGKNFVFDEGDLQFNVTIISEEPTSIENVMTALIQELRIHDLTLMEQGNNLIIHKSLKVNSVSKVVADNILPTSDNNVELVTQVFRLNTLDPAKAAAVIRPLVSERALVEPLPETRHLIVTDVVSNVNKISELLKSIDAPNSGLVIGQYVARTADIETLVPLVQKIMHPISQDQPLSFVPYASSNSLFIVSTPFLVERSISILQHLDQEKGKTRIIELSELKFQPGKGKGPTGAVKVPIEIPLESLYPPAGGPMEFEEGWQYGPFQTDLETHLKDLWQHGGEKAFMREGKPVFIPVEVGEKCEEGAQMAAPPPLSIGDNEIYEEQIPVERIRRPLQGNNLYMPVPINREKFYIHKLQYRTGDVILGQIQQIAASMANTTGNQDLLIAISTMQWLSDAKALVITATPETIDKIRHLIEQLDIPLRQVFIEMLILQTTLQDSLHYGVNWGTRFGGGNQAGSTGFLAGASPLQGSLDTTGVTDLGGQFPNSTPGLVVPFNNALIPNPNNLAKNVGFSLGVLGQHIVHNGLGLEFNSIGALVSALHDYASTNIILSPKIITEDGIPAQIFVGINTPFKTQSVANEFGSIVTNNFEYVDVGTSLQVTPHITNGDIISLDIIEEFSSIASIPTVSNNTNVGAGPTTNKNSTRASILVPDGFFVILSGMIQDEFDENRSQVPCLGSIPLVGAAFSDYTPIEKKSNLMIFLRPKIIDTDEEIQNITRHQQDIWIIKNEQKPKWQVETEAALDFFNVRATSNTDDEDDLPCREFVH